MNEGVAVQAGDLGDGRGASFFAAGLHGANEIPASGSVRVRDPVAHSFAAPNSGTPQWIARDRSKVVGTLISESPNGEGNIPELDPAGEPSGERGGLFSRTTEILRLNSRTTEIPRLDTVGGVAPARNCTPGVLSGVPYQADYLLIQC